MSVRSPIVAAGRFAWSVVANVLGTFVVLQLALPAGAQTTSSPENELAEKRSANPAAAELGSAKSSGAGDVSIQVINLPPKSPLSSGEASEKSSARPAKKGKPAAAKQGKNKQATRRGTPPCLTWIDPDVEPRAVLLCVHGLGLYNGTYEPFGKRIAKLGIATYAIDMRGFGSWMEAKGRERVDFESALADVKAVLRVIHRAHPKLPVFLLGESMGGAIALQSTALFPELVDGLISSVPAADRFEQRRTALNVAFHLLASPNRPMDVGTGVIEKATQKPELRESWSKDPLARLNISPRELVQFQAFMNKNHAAAHKIKTTPVLIVQGCRDRLVRPKGTVELYNELATPDRQLVLMPGSEHLVYEEGQFTDEVVDLTLGWINTHIKTPAPAAETGPALNKNK